MPRTSSPQEFTLDSFRNARRTLVKIARDQEGIRMIVQKESIRRNDFPYSAFFLTGFGRFIGADRGRQMRSLDAGLVGCLRFVACKSKRITMRTRWCVPYLLSRELRFRPIEYSMRATSYRCMRAANQIFLSVNVHARGRRHRNRISRTGSNRTERSDKGQITETAAWSRHKGYLIYASFSGSRYQNAGHAIPFSARRYTRKSLGRCIMQNRAH